MMTSGVKDICRNSDARLLDRVYHERKFKIVTPTETINITDKIAAFVINWQKGLSCITRKTIYIVPISGFKL